MTTTFPPVKDVAKLRREWQLVPSRFREDALQEAWVAHLEGRSAIAAMHNYTKRERKHERREVPFSQLTPDDETTPPAELD
jgi:hypothetical protein